MKVYAVASIGVSIGLLETKTPCNMAWCVQMIQTCFVYSRVFSEHLIGKRSLSMCGVGQYCTTLTSSFLFISTTVPL